MYKIGVEKRMHLYNFQKYSRFFMNFSTTQMITENTFTFLECKRFTLCSLQLETIFFVNLRFRATLRRYFPTSQGILFQVSKPQDSTDFKHNLYTMYKMFNSRLACKMYELFETSYIFTLCGNILLQSFTLIRSIHQKNKINLI